MTNLPDDAHDKCHSTVHVAISTIKGGGQPTATAFGAADKSLLVADYQSKEDLVEAVAASCFLPYFSAPKPTTKFRWVLLSCCWMYGQEGRFACCCDLLLCMGKQACIA